MIPPKMIHWFGCSWVAGWPGGGIPFAHLVSDSLQIQHKNHGVVGLSIDSTLSAFVEQISVIDHETDIVVFCLTSPYRVDLDDTVSSGYWFRTNSTSEKSKIWTTHFANDDTTSYLAYKSINLMYFMCRVYGIKCYFVNAFTKLIPKQNMMVPLDLWLLPPEDCLANDLLHVFSQDVLRDDIPTITVDDWNKQKNLLGKFFIPNDGHPNQLGNTELAAILTNKLKEKLYDPS